MVNLPSTSAATSGGSGRSERVTVVIPARNEAENLPGLLDEVAAALTGRDWEAIVVDDGSSDGTATMLAARSAADPRLRPLHHPLSAGQSAAVRSGVEAARGTIICTLDGDGQNPPADLPRLIAPLEAAGAEGVGLVAGQRAVREDNWSRRAASRFANGLRSRMLRDGTRDTGCGAKAFRRDAFLALPFFDHMHRFLPALFARDGWQVVHVDVSHRHRLAGRSNYSNLQRALVGIVDLFGVLWLLRRRRRARPVSIAATPASLPDSAAPTANLVVPPHPPADRDPICNP